MNVFGHELRGAAKSTSIWAIAMGLFAVLCMTKYETITSADGQALNEVFKSFPHTVQAIFGMNGLDLMTVRGYFGVCFLFIVVILAVYAGLAGARLLSGEEADKTTEFLYTKPRSRMQIILAKLSAGTFAMLVVWGATALSSYLAIQKFATMEGFHKDFMHLMMGALIIMMVFFALGFFAAAIQTRNDLSARVVPVAIFASYLLYVVANLSDTIHWLHYGSIFSYFDARDILAAHSLKLHYIIICLACTLVLITFAAIRYRRRDLRV